MMGRSHALSGVAAGLATAPLLGLHTPLVAAPFAVVVAGYALVPDLDCHGATASRLLGPLTGALSWVLSWCSVRLYQATRGHCDEGGTSHGGHRHMTHCLLFALLTAALAASTSLLSTWVVAGWALFGVLAAASALGDWLLAVAAAGTALPLLQQTSPLALMAEMQGWIGLAVGLGCVVHQLGDAITVTGVPLLFPLSIRGETWQELHLLPRGFRLHTGKRVESWFVFPALVLAAVAATLLIPGVQTSLAELTGQHLAGR